MVDKTIGNANTENSSYGSVGAFNGLFPQDVANQAMAMANELYPQLPEADPWEAAFQFFTEMGRQSSQPGATLLGSAVGSMQAPMDYLNAKKKEKAESDRARMQATLSLGTTLKGKDKVTYRPATKEELAQFGATAGQMGSDGKFYDLSKTSTTTNKNDLKPFGIIDKTKLQEIQRIVPSASLDSLGNVLLTDQEALMAGVRQYIGQKIAPEKSGNVPKPESKADLQGVLRYTANPPEGKKIGDEVWEGIVTEGYTENQLRLADGLRDDLTKALKDFNDINSSMKDINSFYLEAVEQANPISDYSLAVQYAKIIDPGTAAREGEVAAIAGAGSMSGSLRAGLTNAILGTGKLSPRMRASIFNNSLKIYQSKLPNALSTIERYKIQSNKQKEGLFDLVGLNVDVNSYKGVGGDPSVDTNNYHSLILNNFAEDPTDTNPPPVVFPENFSFNGFTKKALLNLLKLPEGTLNLQTLAKIEAALDIAK